MILEFENVVKRYSSLTALKGVTFGIEEGLIFGLLGPNGAGKTTLIRMINQIIGVDEGRILFDGQPLMPKHTQNIGYLPEERGLYPNMKVKETLIYLSKLKGISSRQSTENVNMWLEKFDITSWKNKKIIELSKGMQQKIQFIAAVLHNPKLLILDEPFTGLDPVNTEMIKNEIRNFKEQGATIIFSTHRMEQVEDICEKITLINKGEIILSGEIGEIKDRFKKNLYILKHQGKIPQETLDKFEIVVEKDDEISVILNDNNEINSFLQAVLAHSYIKSFIEKLPSLNEIFIEQVQGESDE